LHFSCICGSNSFIVHYTRLKQISKESLHHGESVGMQYHVIWARQDGGLSWNTFLCKEKSIACVCHRKESGKLQKLCRKWFCMLLWDFRLVCSTSTDMLHGQFLSLLMEEFLIEGCVLNMHKTHDCTPAVKFRKKILCERLYNIADNLCKFLSCYHTWLYRKFRFAWKIWLCATPKVGVSLIQVLSISYIRSATICVSTRMLISISDDEKLILDVYECRHHIFLGIVELQVQKLRLGHPLNHYHLSVSNLILL